MTYTEAIIIGNGGLPYSVAKSLAARGIGCLVIDYKGTKLSLLARMCARDKIRCLSLEKEELTQLLLAVDPDTMIISANNIYLFPTRVLERLHTRVLNFHPALLPRHPGRNAEAWCIFEGDAETGVTWHVVDSEIDRGGIVIQRKLELDDTITAIKLMRKQIEAAKSLFEQIADLVICDGFTAHEMSHDTNRCIHYSYDKPNGGVLCEDWPVEKISRFLRAMDYGCERFLGDPFLIRADKTLRWKGYRIEKNLDGTVSNAQQGIYADEQRVVRLLGLEQVIE